MQVTKWLVVEAEKWSSIAEQGWFGALVTAVGSLQPPHVSVFQPGTYTAGHLANNIGLEHRPNSLSEWTEDSSR